MEHRMKTLFYKLPETIRRCFSGYAIVWHLLAILLTYIIVTTGFDWRYFLATRNAFLRGLLFPAIVLGALLPIIIPLALIAIGAARENIQTRTTGWALAQAAIVGLCISSVYKAFTGRIQPNLLNTLVDSSRQFQFGFMRGGVFWGWPSSHTTVAFAMAVTLIYLYPKNKLVAFTALLYAFYIGFGVSISIHWFSEFVAGAIIGSVIGAAVGRSFRN